MADKGKQLKTSIGILTGYFLAAIINVIFFDKKFIEAVSDKRLILLFSGILLSAWIINREKRKKK